MLIKVIYHDDRHDMVKPFLLDELIETGKVKMFHRSDGWAIIGYSPLRRRCERFSGKEKRIRNDRAARSETSALQPGTAPGHHQAVSKKQNCWEFMQCGRESGGKKVPEFGCCPASTVRNLDGIHGGKNAGRACWVVAGTMCQGIPQGTFAQKTRSCGRCPFYKAVRNEEEDRVATILLLELSQAEDVITLEIS